MRDRQASIYVPPGLVATPSGANPNWGATVLGELKPTLAGTGFDWIWATKYGLPWSADPTGDLVPGTFRVNTPNGDYGCFVKFRYRTAAPPSFESAVQKLCAGRGWHAVFRDYDLVGDLGTDRFLSHEQQPGSSTSARRAQRATVLVDFLTRTLFLALDALVSDGAGGWRLEVSGHPENPTGSTFQSMVHLVCNLTDARTLVGVQTSTGMTRVEVSF